MAREIRALGVTGGNKPLLLSGGVSEFSRPDAVRAGADGTIELAIVGRVVLRVLSRLDNALEANQCDGDAERV